MSRVIQGSARTPIGKIVNLAGQLNEGLLEAQDIKTSTSTSPPNRPRPSTPPFSLFPPLTMSLAASRAVLRHSTFAMRRAGIRNASSTSEAAGAAKEKVAQASNKASEGLSKVTSSVSEAASRVGSAASEAANATGGRVGGVVGSIQGQ